MSISGLPNPAFPQTSHQACALQDLVEALSDVNAWNTPRKVDQATFERKPDGTFAGFERTPPFEYHDGYLSVHFATNNYLEIGLNSIQEEAVWCVTHCGYGFYLRAQGGMLSEDARAQSTLPACLWIVAT